MRKLMILSATVLLASAGGAFAEDNADLLQPISFGAVTGDAEKDTMAYDMAAPSDLQVRFEKDCGGRSAPIQRGLARPAGALRQSASRRRRRVCAKRQRTARPKRRLRAIARRAQPPGPWPGTAVRPAWLEPLDHGTPA